MVLSPGLAMFRWLSPFSSYLLKSRPNPSYRAHLYNSETWHEVSPVLIEGWGESSSTIRRALLTILQNERHWCSSDDILLRHPDIPGLPVLLQLSNGSPLDPSRSYFNHSHLSAGCNLYRSSNLSGSRAFTSC
jgi:hypothetical protein